MKRVFFLLFFLAACAEIVIVDSISSDMDGASGSDTGDAGASPHVYCCLDAPASDSCPEVCSGPRRCYLGQAPFPGGGCVVPDAGPAPPPTD